MYMPKTGKNNSYIPVTIVTWRTGMLGYLLLHMRTRDSLTSWISTRTWNQCLWNSQNEGQLEFPRSCFRIIESLFKESTTFEIQHYSKHFVLYCDDRYDCRSCELYHYKCYPTCLLFPWKWIHINTMF